MNWELKDPYQPRMLPRLTSRIKRRLQAVGLDLVRYPHRQGYDWHLALAFNKLEIDCLLDVGANTGQFARKARSMGYTGKIISFEPVPEAFAELSKNMRADQGWTGYNIALGDFDGVADFNVSAGDAQASSLLKLNGEGPKRHGDAHRLSNVISTSVHRIDSLGTEILSGLSRPRIFLKMDTQGYDHKVFAGAGYLTDKIVGLQTEIALSHYYDDMIPFSSAVEIYLRLGYGVVGIFPLSRELDHLQVTEFDFIFSRRSQ